jgi:hypothetical protein
VGVTWPQAVHERAGAGPGWPAAPGAVTAGGDPGLATVAGEGSGAPVPARSEVPHILQKFMPGGLTVWHFGQVIGPPVAGPAALDGRGGGVSSGAVLAQGLMRLAGFSGALRRWPQSWQKTAPSRLTRPHWEQRAMSRVHPFAGIQKRPRTWYEATRLGETVSNTTAKGKRSL